MPRLEFSQFHSYPSSAGISLPVSLKYGGEVVDLLADLDTGASNCLFERKHGEFLNLRIESGHRQGFRTATGGVEAFGHFVEIEVCGLRSESMVYFFADDRMQRNLLGRAGWLDRVRLGLVHHDCELYLATYD